MSEREVEYILVGAGLPRTGTTSTLAALEQLLPGRCHHMTRTFSNQAEQEFWHQASQGQLTDQDWREFIRSSQLSASVDYPMSLYWKDLARLYPHAKVLLTVRDPVKWYHSVKNTIRQVLSLVQDSWLGAPVRLINSFKRHNPLNAAFTCFSPSYLGPSYPRGMFGAVDNGQETAVRFFKDWVEQVRREIPAERLLVWEVKEGWGPLCQFLEVPVPQQEFPNVNDTQEMLQKLRALKRFCYFCWGLGFAAVGVGGYFLKHHIDLEKIVQCMN